MPTKQPGITTRAPRAEVEQASDPIERVISRALSVVEGRRVRHFEDAVAGRQRSITPAHYRAVLPRSSPVLWSADSGVFHVADEGCSLRRGRVTWSLCTTFASTPMEYAQRARTSSPVGVTTRCLPLPCARSSRHAWPGRHVRRAHAPLLRSSWPPAATLGEGAERTVSSPRSNSGCDRRTAALFRASATCPRRTAAGGRARSSNRSR